MKKYLFLVLVLICVLACGSSQPAALVVESENQRISYRNLESIPEMILVKAPCTIYSQFYAVTVHFPKMNSPAYPAYFAEKGGFFKSEVKIRLNGTENPRGLYLIKVHPNDADRTDLKDPIRLFFVKLQRA